MKSVLWIEDEYFDGLNMLTRDLKKINYHFDIAETALEGREKLTKPVTFLTSFSDLHGILHQEQLFLILPRMETASSIRLRTGP